MQSLFSRVNSYLLLGCGIALLSSATHCRGEKAASAATPTKGASLQREIAALRREVRDLRGAIEDLSQAVAPDYTAVKIRVQTPNGEPLEDCEVRLFRGSGDSRISVRGTSGADGVALERRLPYGEYSLRLNTAAGFSVYQRKLMVEIGKELDHEVVAPQPDQWGKLTLETALDFSGLAGLPFGTRREPRGGRSFMMRYAPEPGEDPGNMWNFPTLGDGIERVAVNVRIVVNRHVEQPDGTKLEWSWGDMETKEQRDLLITADAILQREQSDSGSVKPQQGLYYFSEKRPIESATTPQQMYDYEVGYLDAELESTGESTCTLKLPVGTISIYLIDFWGQANQRAIESLQLSPQKGHTIWFEASLKRDSVWPARAIRLEQWQPRDASGFDFGHFSQREITLEVDRKAAVRIESP